MRTISASQPNSFWLINWHILGTLMPNLQWRLGTRSLPKSDHLARDIGLDPADINELKSQPQNLIGQHPML